MAALYSQIADAVESTLRDNLPEDVNVTQEVSPPTVEQCPIVVVSFDSFERQPSFIARPSFGGSYYETVRISIDCWAFSGQSATDAFGQRDELVAQVMTAIEQVPEINGQAMIFQCLRGEAMTGQGAGIHSGMRLLCEAQLIT